MTRRLSLTFSIVLAPASTTLFPAFFTLSIQLMIRVCKSKVRLSFLVESRATVFFAIGLNDSNGTSWLPPRHRNVKISRRQGF